MVFLFGLSLHRVNDLELKKPQLLVAFNGSKSLIHVPNTANILHL